MARLLIAREDALLVATPDGGGRGWSVDRQLVEASPLCLAVDPNKTSTVYCGTWGSGAWRSDDGGDSWSWVGQNLPHGRVTAVAVSPVEESPPFGVVYVGSDPTAVCRSEDGGERWEDLPGLEELPSADEWSFPPRPDTHHVRWIACDPNRTGRIFVAVEAGALVRSPDGGRTWEDRTPGGPRDTHTLILHPKAPGRLWAAAGDGYYESGDAGATWRRFEAGLDERYAWSVVVDPDDPDLALVSVSPGPTFAHVPASSESRVYRRWKAEPWQPVETGFPQPMGTTAPILGSDPFDAGVFYAACNRGAFRSRDGGVSWRELPLPWSDADRGRRVRALAVLP